MSINTSVWRDYKAVNLDTEVVGAFFQQNEELVAWVNQQPLPEIFSCLGDRPDGIWHLFAKIGNAQQRCETLDWYYQSKVSPFSRKSLENRLN